MSRGVQFDIYVWPADANESLSPKNESACRGNLICAKSRLLLYTHPFVCCFFSKNVAQLCRNLNVSAAEHTVAS